MGKYASLIAFVALVVVVGGVIGIFTAPGEWYASLQKPPFNPPSWIFGPVWTVLYVLIGIAGWRIWRVDRTSAAMVAWWVQLALNFLWSPIFFAAENIALALVVVLAMLVTILTFIVLSWRVDRTAAVLFIPYACWVSFASLLNASIWWLN